MFAEVTDVDGIRQFVNVDFMLRAFRRSQAAVPRGQIGLPSVLECELGNDRWAVVAGPEAEKILALVNGVEVTDQSATCVFVPIKNVVRLYRKRGTTWELQMVDNTVFWFDQSEAMKLVEKLEESIEQQSLEMTEAV